MDRHFESNRNPEELRNHFEGIDCRNTPRALIVRWENPDPAWEPIRVVA